jgi:hypothetical protein
MRRIASSKELQAELTKLLAYAQTDRPSRVLIANELMQLGVRLAGQVPEAFLENIQKMKDKAKDKDDDKKDDDKDQE